MHNENRVQPVEELHTRRITKEFRRIPFGIRIIQGLLVLDLIFIAFNAFIRFQESGILMTTQLLFAVLLGVSVWGMQQKKRWSYYLTGAILLFVLLFSFLGSTGVPWLTVLISLLLLGLLVRNRDFFAARTASVSR